MKLIIIIIISIIIILIPLILSFCFCQSIRKLKANKKYRRDFFPLGVARELIISPISIQVLALVMEMC